MRTDPQLQDLTGGFARLAGFPGLNYAYFGGATNIVHSDWRAYSSGGRIYIEEQAFGFSFPHIGGTIRPGLALPDGRDPR